MWGKFFAFAMLVLILLVIVQFSTLSDKDVEKIKAKIELQQQASKSQNETPLPSSSDQSVTYDSSQTDPYLSEPPVEAYEAFLDAIPEMKHLSDIDAYYVATVLDEYKERLTDFSSDPLDGFKGMHDLKSMEYMGVQKIGDELVIITFIASNRLTRVVSAGDAESLAACRVLMKNENDQWLIQDESWVPQGHPAFTAYEALLAEYHKKRQSN